MRTLARFLTLAMLLLLLLGSAGAMTIIDRLGNVPEGLAYKAPCTAVATANITLTGLQTIDGVALVANQRVLVAGQTDATQNGIYQASTGPWQRPNDVNGNQEWIGGTQVLVTSGTTYAKTTWLLSCADDPVVIGTSHLTFNLGAAASVTIVQAGTPVFATIAAMQAAVPQAGAAVVQGYFAPGDGGGGQFYFDAASSATVDGGTIFSGSGAGRWKRVYQGAVNVDWFGANNSGADAATAFAAAAAFPSVYVPNRSYLMNGSISILAGQQWKFDGSIITHTDNTKVMFKAVAVDFWKFQGPVTLTGLLVTDGNTGEKGLYVEACRRFRVEDITATLFLGPAIHIAPGTRGFSSFLGDIGQWSNIHVDQSHVGLQADAGTAAEYQTFTNLNATGNITGVQIAAGNYLVNGGNIVGNVTNGLVMTGGSNNGHGVISGVNINHNASYNVIADGVTNGFTLNGVHVYADSLSTGKIWFKNSATGVAILGGIVDSPIVHDSAGTNRIFNTWTSSGTFFGVTGANTGGLVQSGNY